MSTPGTMAIDARLPAGAAAARPSLARLIRVELRKMTDTRSGFWLQLAVLGLTALTVVIVALAGHESDHSLREMLSAAIQPASILLPVAGILLVTQEWSQRTGLITFALVPDRRRVIAAKLGAGVVLALAAALVAIVFSAIGTAATSPDIPNAWSLPVGLLGQDLLNVVTSMITGVAFGAALLASAPAIVLYFGLPAVWSALGTISFMQGIANWLDASQTLSPLTEEVLTGKQWAQALATLVLWMLVPLAIGVWRVARSEVR
jgi:ABC-2 type transport system permease protein